MNDLSVFSGNEFNATHWINQLVDNVPQGESIETFISSVGMKLHMAAQDYSEQLETAMIESMSTMPRMITEINRLQDQLVSVQEEMKVISDHIHSVDERSVAGVEELSRLDHIKSNMEKCRATLEEHARWNQLVREARALLEGGGGELSETADR
jgi:methyl-accepting chemotaxis protein